MPVVGRVFVMLTRIIGFAMRFDRIIVAAVACLATPGVSAQQIVPSLEWEHLYYNSACDVSAILQTADGGYVLGGRIYDVASQSRQEDCILVKIGSQGELQWEKIYGGSGNDIMRSLRRTTDGGYVYAATSDSPRSGNKESLHFGMEDVWVVKVDATGNKQWERSIGGNGNDSAASIWQTSEGEYIVAGTSPGPFTVPSRWVIKINRQGEQAWIRYLGDKIGHSLVSLIQTADGGYALAGGLVSASETGDAPHFGGSDGWLMKVDAEGNKQWERFFGGTGDELVLSIDQSADGGFILGGRSDSPTSGNKESRHFGGFDYWLVKVDAAGNKQWDRSYGTSSPSVEEVRVVRQTTDQGYIFGGYVGGSSRLVKVDGQGRQQWDEPLGDPDNPGNSYIVETKDLQQTRDGGYVLAGSFDIPSAGAPASGCVWGSWVAKFENVVSRAGEVVSWKADAGVVLESADDLKSAWKADESELLSIGGSNAIALVRTAQQRYYRLRKTGTSNDAPSLGLGALLSWSVAANQMLEFSSAKAGGWQNFPGDQGIIGGSHYAIIPENLRHHYFRTRKPE
jgi:hypothetical protein